VALHTGMLSVRAASHLPHTLRKGRLLCDRGIARSLVSDVSSVRSSFLYLSHFSQVPYLSLSLIINKYIYIYVCVCVCVCV
jgi:hypothetical protein